MSHLQPSLQNDKLNQGLVEQIKITSFRFRENVARQTSFIAQKAKPHSIKMGEENSSLFFRHVKERMSKNSITLMKDDRGKLLDKEEDVKEHVLGFIKNLLSNTDEKILELQLIKEREGMEGSMSVEQRDKDVKKSMFATGVNKSPGLDGFRSSFFREAWPIVGRDIRNSVKDIFRNGRPLQ